MADTYTRITLPRRPSVGLLERGVLDFDAALREIRELYRQQLKDAQAVLDAADEDFAVDIVRGSLVQHFVREIKR